MSKGRILSTDQIAVMGDEELRRAIGRTKDAIRRAEESHDFNEACSLQVEACYFLREREVRIARAAAHRQYLQLLMDAGVCPIAEA